MSKATACPPSVVADTIMRTIELGVTITDAAVDEKVTTIFCAPLVRDPRCPDCGRQGRYRDTVVRPLADLPVAGYPLVLRVAIPRYRCVTPNCGRVVFNQDLGKLAAPRSATTRRCPVCVAAVDDRPHHGLGDRRRAWRLLAHREHNRYGRHRRIGGRCGPRPAGRSEDHWHRRAPLGATTPRNRRIRPYGHHRPDTGA